MEYVVVTFIIPQLSLLFGLIVISVSVVSFGNLSVHLHFVNWSGSSRLDPYINHHLGLPHLTRVLASLAVKKTFLL